MVRQSTKQRLLQEVEKFNPALSKPPCKECKRQLVKDEGITIFHNDREVTYLCSRCHRRDRDKNNQKR